MCIKIGEWVENSEDPDKMLHSAASDLDLHSLLRSVFLNTWVNKLDQR